ncbi:hypothetical protein M427DRAFT_28963 [Gonapodya prolifera JEL478]|uniref:Uncharacterized protein n=1 Tax=Gonapodya prolifera (strain JEL478) TaxID=1344416 RepID=A0A139AS03_GONPJ|nr:hypothetical protein M427DRAFT_28963 [Gonapodya prolifera JEL478]|eukprot:KXS19517.1 hypothetical protein M427DRAFT_28963 [Gonapodya prolifera JEL478]
MATASPTELLFAAVEAGDAVAASRSLRRGAAAKARKLVTLRCKVFERLEPQQDGYVGRGAVEFLEDTLVAESALCVAIMRGHIDIVRILLDWGADINEPIEWKISNWGKHWVKQIWNTQRWFFTINFPSALAFALGKLGTIKLFNGNLDREWQNAAERGILPMNAPGAQVVVLDPARSHQTFTQSPIVPDLSMIELLLSRGAVVTNQLVQACGDLEDERIALTIRHHWRQRQWEAQRHSQITPPVTPGAVASDRDSGEDERRSDQQSHSNLSANKKRLSETAFLEISVRLLDAETQNERLLTENAQLREKGRNLQSQIVELTRNARQGDEARDRLQGRVEELEQENNTLRQYLASRAAHSANESETALETGDTLGGRIVREVMYGARDFDALDPGHVSIGLGQRIFVIEVADGWGRGINLTTKQGGYFPMSFVTSAPLGSFPVPSSPMAQEFEDPDRSSAQDRARSVSIVRGNSFESRPGRARAAAPTDAKSVDLRRSKSSRSVERARTAVRDFLKGIRGNGGQDTR